MIRLGLFVSLASVAMLHANSAAPPLVAPTEVVDDDDARLELARALASLPGREDKTESLALYSLLLSRSPSPALRRERRDVAIRLGRLDIAAEDFALLDAEIPLTGAETKGYIDVLRRLNRSAELLAVCRRNFMAGSPGFSLILVEAIRERHSREAAFGIIAELAEAHPGQVDFALATADLSSGPIERNKARNLLAATGIRHPGEVRIPKRIGDLEFAQGNAADALAAYQRAVELDPKDTTLRRSAARAAYAIGHKTQAENLLRAAAISGGRAAQLEWAALKARMDRRPARAVRLYQQWRELEPNDLAAAYGEASSLWECGDTLTAQRRYAMIAATFPDQTAAVTAAKTIADRSRSHVALLGAFLYENSPSRLADISRYQIATQFTLWLGQRFRVSLEPLLWIESPAGVAAPFVANGGTLAAEWISEHWQAQADYTYKCYTTRSLSPTHTGGVSLNWRPTDIYQVKVGYRREDILANVQAFEQRIQADAVRLELNHPANRWLEFSALAIGRWFSDLNAQLEGALGARFVLLDGPGRLDLESRLTMLTTANESVTTQEGNGRETITHPYWTPQHYFRGSIGLSWQRNLWSAGIRTSLDTDLNPAVSISLGIEQALSRKLTFVCRGSYECSPQWNGAQVTTSLVWTF